MGGTLTSIQCNAQQSCTCALPTILANPRSEPSQASIYVAHTKDDVRNLVSNRPNQPTCLLVPSRAVTGLRHTLLKTSTLIHTYASDNHLGEAINAHAKKPSLIFVFRVPPDTRTTGECETLATTELPQSRLTTVYPGTVKSVGINCLFDSGASACFIGIETVRKLKLDIRPSRLKSVATATGKSTPTLGSVTFPLRLDATVMEITAHILPTFLSKVQLIIGQDWMEEHSVRLSYNPSQCTIRNNSTDMVLQHTTLPAGRSHQPPDSDPRVEANSLGNEISVNMAVRLLKRHSRNAFVALIRPHEIAIDPDPSTIASTIPEAVPEVSTNSRTDNPAIPNLDHVPDSLKMGLEQLLSEYSDIFNETPQAGGALVDTLEHTIDLIPGTKPAFRRNYRLSPLEVAELRKQVTEFLEKGIITPSNSPFGAPVLFIPKPGGGLRFCLDYRGLNDMTVKTRYQLPRIDDLLDAARGASHFTTLDMASGYYQLRIAEGDCAKTAFATPFGHFEWRVLPMGLTNAPCSFQRTMQKVFEKFIGDFVLVYLDDILVMSKTAEAHIGNLRQVFTKLREHRFQVKLSKCKFMDQQVKYLGHILSKDGIQADPSKIKTLVDWEPPSNGTGMLQFLGLANYFRKFIPNFSRLSAPLYHLTKKGIPYSVGEEAQMSFEAIKHMLVSPPILSYPNPELPYELISDASLAGCGAVLTQEGKPIAYFSSRFSSAERNYTTGEQELLGIIKALKEWRCYLEGCNGLTLITDHNPLTFFSVQPTLSRRQARWSEFLSRFHFVVKYRPGATNPADSLSRLGMEHPLVLLAVTVSEFSSDILTRIKAATLLDPHFSDEKECRKYTKHAGYWTYQGRIVVPESMRTEIVSYLDNSGGLNSEKPSRPSFPNAYLVNEANLRTRDPLVCSPLSIFRIHGGTL